MVCGRDKVCCGCVVVDGLMTIDSSDDGFVTDEDFADGVDSHSRTEVGAATTTDGDEVL